MVYPFTIITTTTTTTATSSLRHGVCSKGVTGPLWKIGLEQQASIMGRVSISIMLVSDTWLRHMKDWWPCPVDWTCTIHLLFVVEIVFQVDGVQ